MTWAQFMVQRYVTAVWGGPRWFDRLLDAGRRRGGGVTGESLFFGDPAPVSPVFKSFWLGDGVQP